MRSLIKQAAARVPLATFDRLRSYAIPRQRFGALDTLPQVATREALWDGCLRDAFPADEPVTFVEFGVHEGYSIEYFASRHAHPDSVFIGLDSFEGLPEDWGIYPKGTFDLAGAVPVARDPRIRFIKGWFQDTADELLAQIGDARRLVVHYDADLYSSTLFALSQIDRLKRPYAAIFDEFIGHETRALDNYLSAFNASVTFDARTRVYVGQFQVRCTITPRGA